MTFRVMIIPAAREAILQEARRIAVDEHAPINAARWLSRVIDAADTLEHWPRRCPQAPENAFRPYEVRKLNVGDYMLLFTVVDTTRMVWVIGFRHGSRKPREDTLPRALPD